MVTDVGGYNGQEGAALNSHGQVVVSVRFGSGPDTMALLTPTAP